MSKNKIIGDKGEQLAIDYLQNKNYEIVETNWRIGHKEIDIIAIYNNVLVFVEVKTRKNVYLSPEDVLSYHKEELLTEAADLYIEKNKINNEIRFDLIIITYINNKFFINHFEDAF